tara:strand:+ start:1236 stop:2492 length:1257 start_codon:yes stop_codon:yes gene_type:complete
MSNTSLFDPIQILYDSTHLLTKDAVLIQNNEIKAFGDTARELGKENCISPEDASQKLLAPCLVDPHSTLLDPINGKNENLNSLIRNASNAGYGQLALLPDGHIWRDRPEVLLELSKHNSNVFIHALGSFSLKGEGKELSPHADLLDHGAIGIAESNAIPPSELLRKALLLNEINTKPIFLAPRDPEIQSNGIVREGIETLRAGWVPDPVESETLPLSQLLELQRHYPKASLRLMNISTAAGVSMLENNPHSPMASVCWWNLIADSSTLLPTEIGWKVIPSLGTPDDRGKLIEGLRIKTITGVSVNSIALDDAEVKQPIDHRQPGISGHHLVLPLLWQELVVNAGWKVEQLWESISFGPSKMLQVPEESLKTGSKRWLIFDPNEKWIQTIDKTNSRTSFNQPFERKEICGKITSCGIST